MAPGIIVSVFSSLSFALLYYLVALMQPLSGLELVGWRTLFLVPSIGLLLVATKRCAEFSSLWAKVGKRPVQIVYPLLSATLLLCLQWLFLWAPVNGYALDVTLGFFLMPLVIVLTGHVFFKEHLTRTQGIAAFLAACGVANEIWVTGGFNWPAMGIAFGYAVYFAVRKTGGINHLGGLFNDLLFSLPICIWLIASMGIPVGATLAETPQLYWLLPIFIVVSAASLALYILSSAMLPLSLFGLLTYAEPLLLLGVSYLLGESIRAEQLPTYALIWLALALMAAEGIMTAGRELHLVRKARQKQSRAD